LYSGFRQLKLNYRLKHADTKEAMKFVDHSENSVLEADKILNKPLVSVLSGEDFIQKTPPKKSKKDHSIPSMQKQRPASQPFFSPSIVKGNYNPSGEKPSNDLQQSHRNPFKNLIKLPRRILLLIAVLLTTSGAGVLAASLISHSHPSISLPDENSAQEALMAMLEPEPSSTPADESTLPPIPSLLAEKTYTIRRGDTLQTIASRFGIREDTIISANNLSSKSQIQVGKTLKIPNMNGVYHSVKKNESLSSISRAYGVDMTRIADANNMSSATIRIGERIFIPNAKLNASVLRNFYGETFIWPVRGQISSPFGYRINPFSGQRTFHAAIDIVVNRGTAVKATREGKVADKGYNAVFGNYVIIRHADGYQSLYAHLDSILAQKGASVNQGETIGRSGNTGQSTGPHLHFAIFRNGQAVDPRQYVK